MDRDTALALYSELEKQTFGWVGDLDNKGYTSALYSVRLDARIDDSMEDDRSYAIFARVNSNAPDTKDALRALLDLVDEHDDDELTLVLENAGAMIT